MRCGIVVIGLLVTAISRPVNGLAAEAVPISIDRSGGVAVPVTIDGHGPFVFLLDTGSSHSVISKDIADRFSLVAVAKTTVVTSAGTDVRIVVALPHTSIGRASSEGLTATVVAPDELDRIFPGSKGIIGQDFLSAFNYTLDYRGKRLSWDIAESKPDKIRIPLVHQEGRLLAKIQPTANSEPLHLVLDTGAERVVIYERNGRVPMNVDTRRVQVGVSGLAGRSIDAETGTLGELTIGCVTLRRLPVLILDRSGLSSLEGDGLLPLHLFASVTINSREGYMVVKE